MKEGDEVISGCINMTGELRIQTTKEFGESTVSKILELVEDSSSHKSKSENFISKFARVYTPLSATALWRWQFCLRWSICFWAIPQTGAAGSTVL